MLFIDKEQIRSAAKYKSWIDCMEKALVLDQDRDFIMPQRMHVDFDENTLLLMPCITEEYLSTKLVTLFPENINIGQAPLSGLVILNDGKTGKPVSVLEGSSLTAMRTAAVGSVGVRHLAPSEVKTLGIIGLGIQGIHQAIFACSERNFTRVFINDKVEDNVENFKRSFSSIYPEIELVSVDDTKELCATCDVIITATNSTSPVLPDDPSILTGKTIIGIGSYKPEMREFPDSLFGIIDHLFIDTEHGMKETGDLIDPLKREFISRDQFIPLGNVIEGKVSPGHTRVFKSVGMAIFDLFAARLVYESVRGNENDK